MDRSEVPVSALKEMARAAVDSMPHRDSRLLADTRLTYSPMLRPGEGWGAKIDWIMPTAPCGNCYSAKVLLPEREAVAWYTRSLYTGNYWRPTPVFNIVRWKSAYTPKGQPSMTPHNLWCYKNDWFMGSTEPQHAEAVDADVDQIGALVWVAQVGHTFTHGQTASMCHDCWYNDDDRFVPLNDHERIFFKDGAFRWDNHGAAVLAPAWDVVPIKDEALPTLAQFWLNLETDPIWPYWFDYHNVWCDPPSEEELGYDFGEHAEDVVNSIEKSANDAEERIEAIEFANPDQPAAEVVDDASKRNMTPEQTLGLNNLIFKLLDRSLLGWVAYYNQRPDMVRKIPVPIRLMTNI